MYKLIVGEISRERKKNWKRRDNNPYTVWEGNTIASPVCRISALSSADYLLRDRVDVDWDSIAWKGSASQIRRLFEAERLDMTGLDILEPGKDYAVLFLEICLSKCA